MIDVYIKPFYVYFGKRITYYVCDNMKTKRSLKMAATLEEAIKYCKENNYTYFVVPEKLTCKQNYFYTKYKITKGTIKNG